MDRPPSTAKSSSKDTDQKGRRLAAALRENLKRRKAQARAKEETGAGRDEESG